MASVKTKVKEEKDPRLTKVKSILVSQPEPKTNVKSPYHSLAEKYNLKIDFKQFIQVRPLDIKEFRKQKIEILDYTAIIFTSRNAVDGFFKICQESKIEMPAETKYFCVSEQTANYLQKYITIRKRKIFVGEKSAKDLEVFIAKNKNDNYLYPCSNIRKDELPSFLRKNGFKHQEAIIYETVAADLKGIDVQSYDILAFFSPSGVASLKTNFPDFKQKNIRIAAFGPTTSKAVRDAGLILDIEAPMPNAPSMTGAIEVYIKQVNSI